MKSLVDLKKEIKNGDIKNLYVFVGEENLISLPEGRELTF